MNNPTHRGHHYVEFKVVVPTEASLSPNQKRLMLEWAREEETHRGTVTGLDEFLAASYPTEAVESTDSTNDTVTEDSASSEKDASKESSGWGSWFSSSKKDKKSKRKGNDDDSAAEAK